jgi:putative oxidoreductase
LIKNGLATVPALLARGIALEMKFSNKKKKRFLCVPKFKYMKKLLSTKYSASAFNIAMLILRVGLAGMMLPHGYDKMVHFGTYQKDFTSFLGMGGAVSLALDIFAEFFCSIFLLLGLFSRLAVIPLIIAMSVALVKAHKLQVFGEGEHSAMYIVGFLVILLVGPGRISVDAMTGK